MEEEEEEKEEEEEEEEEEEVTSLVWTTFNSPATGSINKYFLQLLRGPESAKPLVSEGREEARKVGTPAVAAGC